MPPCPPSSPLATRLHLALYALVCVAIAGFAYTDRNPAALILLLPALLLAWLLVDGPHPQSRGAPGIPAIFLNVIVLAAACYLWYEVVSDHGHQALITSLTHFMVVLTLCKLLERKTPRNAAQIIILSLLIVIASAMFSSSDLLFFLILVGYFALLFYVAMLLNVSLELHRAAADAPPLRDLPRSPSRFHRDLRDCARQCLFLIFPLAVIVFLAVPRTNSTALTTSWNASSLQTGFTDTVQFRDYGQLSLSDTPVMTVWLSRGFDIYNAPIRVTSEYNDLYIRGQVLEQYNAQDRRWEHGSPDSHDAPFPASLRPDSNLIAHFDLEPVAGSALFCLAPLASPSDRGISYSSHDMTLRYNGLRPPVKFHYYLSWFPDAHPLNDTPATASGLLGAKTAHAPEVLVSREITLLAQRLAGKFLDPGPPPRVAPENARLVIPTFEQFLRANYPYSLTFRQIDKSKDPTTDFILNRKQTGGYCDYFASAMVMMCRAVGLNARIVVGFHGGQYNPVDNSIIVRQKDAHTWAEVYLPDQGWATSDPTPSAAESDSVFRFVGRWFRDLATVVQNLWLSVVVSFDNDSRHAIAIWFAKFLDALSWLVNASFWKAFLAGLWGPLAALALAVTSWWTFRHWRQNPRLLASASSDPLRNSRDHSDIAFLDALLHLFQQPNRPRRPDQTPLEFLQPHLDALGPGSPEAYWLIYTAYGIRFGHLHISPDLRSRIALALRHVEAARGARGLSGNRMASASRR